MALTYNEVTRAINLAEGTLDRLYQGEQLLETAKKLGVVDILGGGIVISAVKQEKLRCAQVEIDAGMKKLKELLKLLGENGRHSSLDVKVSTLLQVTEYIPDNIITDVLVQEKINRSRATLADVIDKVQEIRLKLLDIRRRI